MSEYGYDVLEGHAPEKMSLRQLQDDGFSVCEGKKGTLLAPTDTLMAGMVRKLAQRMDEWEPQWPVNDNPRLRAVEKDRETQRGSKESALEHDGHER